MTLVRHALKLFALVSVLALSAKAEAADWVYFDLGEVIVSGNPTDGYTYVPGALDFLKALRLAGYKTAALTNIPEAWGATCGAKFDMLKEFLGSRLHEPVPFDWTLFDAVLLPPFDRYRKPHKYMFLNGLANACPGKALYIGENAPEIGIARALGLATFHMEPGLPLPTVAHAAELIASDFTFVEPEQCDFQPLFQQVLLPADQGAVSGCHVVP